MKDYDLVKIFKALADKTRQDILELLAKRDMNVTDICSVFHTTQPTISHHLQILKNCGLVDFRKEGKNVYYYVQQEVMDDCLRIISQKMRLRKK